MTTNTIAADPAADEVYGSLRSLADKLAEQGLNANERAHVLINSCIEHGINKGSQILDELVRLGFDRRHAGITLQAGIRRAPEWPNWGRDQDRCYYAPPQL